MGLKHNLDELIDIPKLTKQGFYANRWILEDSFHQGAKFDDVSTAS